MGPRFPHWESPWNNNVVANAAYGPWELWIIGATKIEYHPANAGLRRRPPATASEELVFPDGLIDFYEPYQVVFIPPAAYSPPGF